MNPSVLNSAKKLIPGSSPECEMEHQPMYLDDKISEWGKLTQVTLSQRTVSSLMKANEPCLSGANGQTCLMN